MVTTASVTSLLDTLERRELVTRSPDPDDRRKVLVELTAAGRELVEAFLPQLVAVQTAILSGLSEPQRHQLVKALTSIRTAAAELDADAVVAAARPRGTPRRG